MARAMDEWRAPFFVVSAETTLYFHFRQQQLTASPLLVHHHGNGKAKTLQQETK